MDASTAVVKLHEIDPQFRALCASLYPGLDAREVAGAVYGDMSKANPDGSEAHAPSPVWRNGRGAARGRGRRRHHTDVKSVQVVSTQRGIRKQTTQQKRNKRLAIAGLGASGVATVGGLHALKTTVANENPMRGAAIRAGKAGPAAMGLARRIGPGKAAAALGAGWVGLHGVELAGDVLGMRAQARELKQSKAKIPAVKMPKPPKQKQSSLFKHWDEAQQMIVKAVQDGRLGRDEALVLGREVYTELMKAETKTIQQAQRGADRAVRSVAKEGLQGITSSKLAMLKAPKIEPVAVGAQQPGKQTVSNPTGKKKTKVSNPKAKGVSKGTEQGDSSEPEILIEGQISKLDEDKMQSFGWASVVKIDGKTVIDKQADLIEIDDIEDAAYAYVQTSGIGGDMHRRNEDGTPYQASTLIESMVFTPEKIAKLGLPESMPQGWWIGMQHEDPEVWADVKSGKKKGFSIHGHGLREVVFVDG